jgi:hypothetical protein
MKDKLVHRARVAEADLGLLRVDIDIDSRRVDFQEQTVSRVAAAVQQVLVSLAQGMAQ